MAGLVPAIHVLFDAATKKDVDARHKAGMTKETTSRNLTHDNQV
jgi:hypothetical protein